MIPPQAGALLALVLAAVVLAALYARGHDCGQDGHRWRLAAADGDGAGGWTVLEECQADDCTAHRTVRRETDMYHEKELEPDLELEGDTA